MNAPAPVLTPESALSFANVAAFQPLPEWNVVAASAEDLLARLNVAKDWRALASAEIVNCNAMINKFADDMRDDPNFRDLRARVLLQLTHYQQARVAFGDFNV